MSHACWHGGKHADKRFDYLIANPPYGKKWEKDEDAVRAENERGYAGRFGAGLPRIADGQLLFLQHMLSRMQNPKKGGSRVAIVMNGSPLFTGDAESGETEIRRWILENDWLEAIVALPEQLFYNTGIATYVWILTNRKESRRRGKVQLIDATSFWTPMRKSLGDKRREVPEAERARILALFTAFVEVEHCKVLPAATFGYRKVTVERPLRLNFQASDERVARLSAERAFVALSSSRKKGKSAEAEEEEGKREQEAILGMLRALPATLFKDRPSFEKSLDDSCQKTGLRLAAPVRKAVLSALSERDESASVCLDSEDHPEPDPELRDTESVPLTESIDTYIDREVKPYVPDAWIDNASVDHKDGKPGKVGYEISVTRYFYKYQPPRPLEAIQEDIKAVEEDILKMLREVAG